MPHPPKSRSNGAFLIVWIVPIVALVIGGWLAFKAISEKGPIITITFTTADGLEAGKTKIKFKDVEIGQVEQIALNEDASKVVVTAKMIKGSEPYLTDQTKFWVVRPRISGGSVSGLGTVLSGAYIGIDGSKTGSPAQSFTGLEVPPVVTIDQPGRHFNLQADTLGSLDIGAPVYYRQIQVGQVVSYNFDQDWQGGGYQDFHRGAASHPGHGEHPFLERQRLRCHPQCPGAQGRYPIDGFDSQRRHCLRCAQGIAAWR